MMTADDMLLDEDLPRDGCCLRTLAAVLICTMLVAAVAGIIWVQV